MPIKPPESGIRTPLRLRVGVDFDTFRGVNKEADPGAIGDGQLQEGINIRIRPNGAIVNRGGQAKLNNSPMGDCVAGIFDDEVASGTRWWFGNMSSFDPLTGITMNDVTAGAWAAGAMFNNLLHVTVGDVLYTWDPDAEALTLVHDFAVVGMTASAGMVVAGTKLYIAMLDATGAIRVYTWDGAAAVLDHTFTVHSKDAVLAVFGGEPYLAYTSTLGIGLPVTPNEVWRRQAGTWTSLAMPAVTNFACFDWVEYSGKLYFAGVSGGTGTMSAVLLSYDGATLAKAREIGNPAADKFVAQSVAVLNGVLCYLHYDANVGVYTGNCYVGTYDGATWTDHFKDIKAQFGSASPNTNIPYVAFEQDNYLYVYGAFPGIEASLFSAVGIWLIRSPAGTPDGVWDVISSVNAPFSPGIVPSQMKGYV